MDLLRILKLNKNRIRTTFSFTLFFSLYPKSDHRKHFLQRNVDNRTVSSCIQFSYNFCRDSNSTGKAGYHIYKRGIKESSCSIKIKKSPSLINYFFQEFQLSPFLNCNVTVSVVPTSAAGVTNILILTKVFENEFHVCHSFFAGVI